MYGCLVTTSYIPISENFMDRRIVTQAQWATATDQYEVNNTSDSPPVSTNRPSISVVRGWLSTRASPLKRAQQIPRTGPDPNAYISYSDQRLQEKPLSSVDSLALGTFPRPLLDEVQDIDLKTQKLEATQFDSSAHQDSQSRNTKPKMKRPKLAATQFDSSAHQDSQNLDTKSKVKRSKYANDEEKREARLKQIRDAMRRSRQRAKDQEYEGTMQIQNLRSRIRVLLSHRTEMMRVIIDSGTLTEEEALRRYPLIEMEQINRLGYSSSLQGVTCAQPSEIDPVTTRSTEHRDTSDKAKRNMSVNFLLNH